jgi:hypothetical protein
MNTTAGTIIDKGYFFGKFKITPNRNWFFLSEWSEAKKAWCEFPEPFASSDDCMNTLNYLCKANGE